MLTSAPAEYSLVTAGAIVVEVNPATRSPRKVIALYPTAADAADYITEQTVRGRSARNLEVLLLVSEATVDDVTVALTALLPQKPLKLAEAPADT